MASIFDAPDGYEKLCAVYEAAVLQASKGKGKARHAEEGEAYEKQIICEVARRVGLGYPLGQAVKKIYESQRLGGDAGLQELLGALNYVAAAFIVMQERVKAETAKEQAEFSAALDKTMDEMNAKVIEGLKKRVKDCKAEPKFKPGDKVQAKLGQNGEWVEAIYKHKFSDNVHLVRSTKPVFLRAPLFYSPGSEIYIVDAVRPAPKAEGCEELVQDTAEECRDCAGFQDGSVPEGCEGCMKTLEADAPQTPHELYKRIVDANPATFRTPSYAEEQLDHHSRLQAHKPTGEELAEMAEEEKHG